MRKEKFARPGRDASVEASAGYYTRPRVINHDQKVDERKTGQDVRKTGQEPMITPFHLPRSRGPHLAKGEPARVARACHPPTSSRRVASLGDRAERPRTMRQ